MKNIWGFPKIVVPKMDGLLWKTLLKWMIWGYHHLRKHPYIDSSCCWFKFAPPAESQGRFPKEIRHRFPTKPSETSSLVKVIQVFFLNPWQFCPTKWRSEKIMSPKICEMCAFSSEVTNWKQTLSGKNPPAAHTEEQKNDIKQENQNIYIYICIYIYIYTWGFP